MSLTNREKQIIDATAHGYINSRIAEDLKVSKSTVNVMLMHVFAKFNLDRSVEPDINTRIKAVLIYLRDYKGIKGLDEYIENHSSQEAV